MDKKTGGEEQICRKKGIKNQIRSTTPFMFELEFLNGGPSEGRNKFESAARTIATSEITGANAFRSHELVSHLTEKFGLPATARLASSVRQAPLASRGENAAIFPEFIP